MSVPTVSRRAGYCGAGSIGLLLAIGYFILTMELPFGSIEQPGPAVFPVVIAVVLAGASVLTIGEGLGFSPDNKIEMPPSADLRRVGVFVVLLFAFLVALPYLGLLVSATVFCMLLMRCLSSLGWARSFVYSLVMCCGVYFVFVRFLKVPLPRGLLDF